MKYFSLLLFLLILLSVNSLLGQVQPDLAKSSIDEILSEATAQKEESASVVTQVETPLRETPGIISVITAEDVKQSGARDLQELLTLLPGFSFAHDVSNVLGINTRGLWGQEGKVMVLIDGHVMNETSYGIFPFAQHIVLDNVQRIEISRGPGSAIYGGVAGLAILNITTKGGDQLAGGFFSQYIGHSEGNLSRQVTTASFGNVYNSGLALSVHGTLNQTNQSNSIITRTDGLRVNYQDSSAIHTAQLGIKASYKGLNVNFLYDDYTIRYTDFTGKSVFEGYYFNSNYTLKVNEKWSIVPMISLKWQQPWNFKNVPGGDEFNLANNRITTSVRGFYKATEKINLLAGVEYYHDEADLIKDSVRMATPDYIHSMSNLAMFAQGIFKTKWFNVTTGFRFDRHSIFDFAFVPRLALTHVSNRWHQKAVVNYAFKAPAFANINSNRNIKPERIHSFDVEVGYTSPSGFMASVNFFITQINKPIIYDSPNSLLDGYRSGESIGSSGFEASASIKKKWGGLKTNYFYYGALPSHEDYFSPLDNQSVFFGSPNQKWVLQTYFNLNAKISLVATNTYSNSMYALRSPSEQISVPHSFHTNLSLTHHQFILKAMRLSLGVYNIFDDPNLHPQAYRGVEVVAPLPGMRRELVVKLSYSFKEN